MASSKDGYTFRERGNMAGIKRVHITDVVNGRGAWRFRDSRRLWPAANQLYRDAFADIGMPLADGDEELECSKDGYDALTCCLPLPMDRQRRCKKSSCLPSTTL